LSLTCSGQYWGGSAGVAIEIGWPFGKVGSLAQYSSVGTNAGLASILRLLQRKFIKRSCRGLRYSCRQFQQAQFPTIAALLAAASLPTTAIFGSMTNFL
jgi:hypothetical protein